jgi:predicted DNA-binding protein with PD1-like motif
MAAIASFAREQQLRATQFTAIDAFSRATSRCMAGSPRSMLTWREGDATAHGGHLVEGHVRPTLEILLTETPAHLYRRFDRSLVSH